MQSKSLLIAIAAFAVTTTGVHAYSGSKILSRSGLTDEQKEAFIEAEERKAIGDVAGARIVLAEAGIDKAVMQQVHQARHAAHAEMLAALQAGDFAAFTAAIADSPLADLITTEADFEQFKEAHELRSAGEFVEAADLFAGLGVAHSGKHPRPQSSQYSQSRLAELNDTQQEAFMVAKQANDRVTMRAILKEAGIDHRPHRGR